jgi:hypothetical protein
MRSRGTFAFVHTLWNIRFAFRGSMKPPWGSGEHQAGVTPMRASGDPLYTLPAAMRAQDLDQCCRDRQDCDGSVRLDGVPTQLTVHAVQCLSHR